MKQTVIAPIVEGKGEDLAVPILLRRIAYEVLGRYDISIARPFRLPRGRMTRSTDISHAMRIQLGIVPDRGGVIVLLDADDDKCPVDLAERLRSNIDNCKAAPEVVVACREYEAWFLAAIESLRGHKDVRSDASYPGDPEAPRDAKGRLESVMTTEYRETRHQAAFSEYLDLTRAQAHSRSFERLCSAMRKLTDGNVG